MLLRKLRRGVPWVGDGVIGKGVRSRKFKVEEEK
jgi:hypothetical protein